MNARQGFEGPREPVVVIGAARSGTTMLREALGAHAELTSCPFELNSLWRSGAPLLRHDQLDEVEHLGAGVASRIRSELEKIRVRRGGGRLVEKTAANALRLAFVAKVLPDARFIHIVRDGRSVTVSAMRRWESKPGWRYLLRKAANVPLRDLPAVARRRLTARLYGSSREGDLPFGWGPLWPSFEVDRRELNLTRLCARQWGFSVTEILHQKSVVSPSRILQIRYEDAVAQPEVVFGALAEFVGVDPREPSYLRHVTTVVRPRDPSDWARHLRGRDLEEVLAEAGDLLERLGYS